MKDKFSFRTFIVFYSWAIYELLLEYFTASYNVGTSTFVSMCGRNEIMWETAKEQEQNLKVKMKDSQMYSRCVATGR